MIYLTLFKISHRGRNRCANGERDRTKYALPNRDFRRTGQLRQPHNARSIRAIERTSRREHVRLWRHRNQRRNVRLPTTESTRIANRRTWLRRRAMRTQGSPVVYHQAKRTTGAARSIPSSTIPTPIPRDARIAGRALAQATERVLRSQHRRVPSCAQCRRCAPCSCAGSLRTKDRRR